MIIFVNTAQLKNVHRIFLSYAWQRKKTQIIFLRPAPLLIFLHLPVYTICCILFDFS